MISKEIYAYRRYVACYYDKHYIKAMYYYLKWKYYERLNERMWMIDAKRHKIYADENGNI